MNTESDDPTSDTSTVPLLYEPTRKNKYAVLDGFVQQLELDEICEQQDEDDNIHVIKSAKEEFPERPAWKDMLSESETVKCLWTQWDSLVVVNSVLYRRARGNMWQLVAPPDIWQDLFEVVHVHKTGGHLGANRTLRRLKQDLWWPGMKHDICHWCQVCDACQKIKAGALRRHSPLTQLPCGAPFK